MCPLAFRRIYFIEVENDRRILPIAARINKEIPPSGDTSMKVKNENFTPRERVNRELLDRMLAESARQDAADNATLPYPATPTMAHPCRENRRYSAPCPMKDTSYGRGESTAPATCRTPVYPGVSLAMVYSPCQAFADLHEPDVGIERGTIFKELDKPFYPTPCNERWCK